MSWCQGRLERGESLGGDYREEAWSDTGWEQVWWCDNDRGAMSVRSILKEKSTGLWFFGAEGEREVKYTINLGKLLSIYKIVIIAVFYRFAMWFNEKTFIKHKKSLAYKCNLSLWNSDGLELPSSFHQSGSQKSRFSWRRKTNAPSFLMGQEMLHLQDRSTILITSCSRRTDTLLVAPSVTVSGRNPLEYNKTCWNILGLSAVFSSTSEVAGLFCKDFWGLSHNK